MKIKAKIYITVRNADNSIAFTKVYPCKSFVIGYAKMLALQMAGNYIVTGSPPSATYLTNVTLVNGSVIAGSSFAANVASFALRRNADSRGVVGDANFGIVVGTGSTTPTISDTSLVTKIAHGTGSGQLSYADVEIDGVTVSGATASWSYKRVFTNNSGASITINETAMYALGPLVTTAAVMLCRDIISGGRLVGNTQSVEVKYTVSVTA